MASAIAWSDGECTGAAICFRLGLVGRSEGASQEKATAEPAVRASCASWMFPRAAQYCRMGPRRQTETVRQSESPPPPAPHADGDHERRNPQIAVAGTHETRYHFHRVSRIRIRSEGRLRLVPKQVAGGTDVKALQVDRAAWTFSEAWSRCPKELHLDPNLARISS